MILFVIYINFIVVIKFFVGEYGGIMVIFSNVIKIVLWVFE